MTTPTSSNTDSKITTNPDSKAGSTPTEPVAQQDESPTFTSQDTFVNPDRIALSRMITSVGPDGIERIAGPTLDGWKPAAIRATDEQIQAAKDHEKFLEKAAKDREDFWKGNTSDESRQPNVPGDGGSNPTSA